MMHSIKPGRVSRLWTRAVNDAIHAQCELHPARFRGIAGLPQFRTESPANCLAELDPSAGRVGVDDVARRHLGQARAQDRSQHGCGELRDAAGGARQIKV